MLKVSKDHGDRFRGLSTIEWVRELVPLTIAETHKLSAATKCTGKVNMLTCLPDSFTLADSQEVRRKQGKDISTTRHMLSVWISRGYITYNKETDVYEQTIKYKLKS